MKTAKKFFQIIGIIIGILVIVLLAYLIYLYVSYHRIEDNLPLEVESRVEQADAKLTTGKEYSALTYNIGFGAYTPDFRQLWSLQALQSTMYRLRSLVQAQF